MRLSDIPWFVLGLVLGSVIAHYTFKATRTKLGDKV